MNKNPRTSLVLKNGKEFSGYSFGAFKDSQGEVVFNTAMTGYPESITDPSYYRQILVLTYPLIGNYGIPKRGRDSGLLKYFESEEIYINGLVISGYPDTYSHWNSETSLDYWLKEHGIPGIYGVDTREITKTLREEGTLDGEIRIEQNSSSNINFSPEIIKKVSCTEKKIYGNGEIKIAVVDCGVKNNILRLLIDNDTTVIRVPQDYDFTKEDIDGILLSNGPGNPEKCETLIKNLSKILGKEIPIFGICLGCQVMALAAGAETYKLRYGHRGHNHPVIMKGTARSFITSQNHSYAIKTETIPDCWDEYFVNLNDKSCEGIRHKKLPYYSVQFHPEASGGPTDTGFLFEKFLGDTRNYKKKGAKK